MSNIDTVLHTPSVGRILAGLLVAPPVAGALVSIFSIIGLPLFPFVVAYAAVLGWPAALLFGVPAYAILRRARVTSRLGYAGTGLVLGALAAAATESVMTMPGIARDVAGYLVVAANPVGYALAAVIGTVAGLIFWRIVRPDGGPTCDHYGPEYPSNRSIW